MSRAYKAYIRNTNQICLRIMTICPATSNTKLNKQSKNKNEIMFSSMKIGSAHGTYVNCNAGHVHRIEHIAQMRRSSFVSIFLEMESF